MRVLVPSNQIRGIDGPGGLADVPVGLAKALLSRGDVDVRLIMPGFGEISGCGLENRFNPDNLVLRGLRVPFGDRTESVDVYHIELPRFHDCEPVVVCYLVRCDRVFTARDTRSNAVDKNSADKAVFFARSVVEVLRSFGGFRVDAVHCNDWHTALIPVYLKRLFQDDPYLGRIATVYTIHNAGGGYQGAFEDPHCALLELAGLKDGSVFSVQDLVPVHPLYHYGKFNFTKAAIVFADVVNTVSPRYREELFSSEFAGGLEGVFASRRSSFAGILNGIDSNEWNPSEDHHLGSFRYSIENGARAVATTKRALRDRLRNWSPPEAARMNERPFANLRDDTVVVGVVSRIDYQKTPILLRSLNALLSGENSLSPLGWVETPSFSWLLPASLS